eukprot:94659-Pleurochrysis_carterae.AAC.1
MPYPPSNYTCHLSTASQQGCRAVGDSEGEIDAALSLHCRHHTRECCQEPIITLRGLAASGVERYFSEWPMVRERDGAQ